jgi:hypothetical protein
LFHIQIANTDLDSQKKTEIEDIMHKFDKETKFAKFYNWIKQNTSIVELVINVAKSIFIGG